MSGLQGRRIAREGNSFGPGTGGWGCRFLEGRAEIGLGFKQKGGVASQRPGRGNGIFTTTLAKISALEPKK